MPIDIAYLHMNRDCYSHPRPRVELCLVYCQIIAFSFTSMSGIASTALGSMYHGAKLSTGWISWRIPSIPNPSPSLHLSH